MLNEGNQIHNLSRGYENFCDPFYYDSVSASAKSSGSGSCSETLEAYRYQYPVILITELNEDLPYLSKLLFLVALPRPLSFQILQYLPLTLFRVGRCCRRRCSVTTSTRCTARWPPSTPTPTRRRRPRKFTKYSSRNSPRRKMFGSGTRKSEQIVAFLVTDSSSSVVYFYPVTDH